MNKKKLNILYEDKYIIVVDKPNNLLTISDGSEKNNLYKEVSVYVKKQHKSNKVFIVHRLDKDTSGIVIFAKNYEVKEKLQANWNETVRKYYALVYGKVNKNGMVKSWLKETKTLYTYSSFKKNDGKFASTEYKVIKTNNKYSLLEINLKTGRKNQIRVHMALIKHPIVGDKKYGINSNPFNRMCLHAFYIKFRHPITKEIIELITPTPSFVETM